MFNCTPHLRLILTGRCNGTCDFCHHEGMNNYSISDDMPLEVIEESAKAARNLNLPYLSLTGGEPTIRNDLGMIIDLICNEYSNEKINLATNGYNLKELTKNIKKNINTVNLSLTSLDIKINMQYQGVDPRDALNSLKEFPANKKNVNILISRSNQNEINDLIDYCLLNNFTATLIFELKKYTQDDYALQQDVLKKLNITEPPIIKLKGIPIIEIGGKGEVSIKHPFLNTLVTRDVCLNCPQITTCHERICAVRVYPNSFVTPCLSGYIKSSKSQVYDRIKDIYEMLSINDTSIFNFLENTNLLNNTDTTVLGMSLK